MIDGIGEISNEIEHKLYLAIKESNWDYMYYVNKIGYLPWSTIQGLYEYIHPNYKKKYLVI